MLFCRRASHCEIARDLSRFASGTLVICLVIAIGSIMGCGEAYRPNAELYAGKEASNSWKSGQATRTTSIDRRDYCRTIPTIRQAELTVAMPSPELVPLPSTTVHSDASSLAASVTIEGNGPYWSFPSKDDPYFEESHPVLIPLPAVDEPAQEIAIFNTGQTIDHQPTAEPLVARLLPPRQVDELSALEIPAFDEASHTFEPSEPVIALPQLSLTTPESTGIAKRSPSAPQSTTSSALSFIAELDEQQRMMNRLLQDSSTATTGVLTDHRINELAKTKIRNAYAMANRGSLYVARQELVEVLRMISQAQDTYAGSNKRSKALAAGLRALREAEDFAPRGTRLEAELDISVLCASHRTPVAEQARKANPLPSVTMDRYLRYAQLQLSLSVAGEPAGSMALHALGKLHSQLGRVEPEKHRLANRRAVAFQQAALLAHNQNHLAAHELGVLLAKSGHFGEAQQLLSQVAQREPNAVVLRNLARVQQELGQTSQAVASRDYAQQLSQQGATGTSTVSWVPPTQFAQSTVRTPRYKPAQHVTAQRQPTGQLPIPGSRQPMTQTIRR